MSAVQIADTVWWVGVKDPDLAYFDIIMKTEHGTTYNSYLVRGSDGAAVIDAVKAGFIDEWLANIQQVVPLDQITHLIVNHTEPDHGGGVARLLEKAPSVKLVCAAPAVPFVRNTINSEATLIQAVKDNDRLDLGGSQLIFKGTPYMHWPDTMMEYLEEDRILFSCDGFAAHIAFDSIFADDTTADFDHEVWNYFDAIMRPFTPYIRRNMTKLEPLDIQMIASSHGPVIRKNPKKYIQKYADWSADKAEGRQQVTIFYVSSYGNTKKLAEAIAGHLHTAGYCPVLLDTFDLDEDRAREEIERARAVLFGTPTFNGDAVRPIWNAVNLLSTVNSVGKKAAVFGSYGWGGEGPKLVADRLAGLRLKVFADPFKARLIPSEDELAEVADYSKRLAQFIG